MIENNKTYGFTIAVKELRETVPNIFRYASAYKRLNNLTSQGLWEMFVEPQETPEDQPRGADTPLPEEILQSEPGRDHLPNIDFEAMEGEKYNMCHFWSNFEIAKLSWFRSKEYNDFFEMMDRSGGFWMERVRISFYLFGMHNTDLSFSGEMPLFILLPLALYWASRISIISVISAIDIPQSSIVQPMRHLASCLGSPTST